MYYFDILMDISILMECLTCNTIFLLLQINVNDDDDHSNNDNINDIWSFVKL